jgi:flagellar protein FliO/FliZ
MTTSILLSRAVARASAVLGACLLALGACLLALAGPACAFTPSPATSKTGGENTPLNLTTSSAAPHTSSGGASIVRTIVGLAIVIAVIWGLSWILRQVKAGRDGTGSDQSSGGLSTVATLQLGSGRSVHLVRAGSEYVLLGSAEHGLMPIHRYTEEQAREVGLLAEVPPQRSRRASLAAQISGGRGLISAVAGREGSRDPSATPGHGPRGAPGRDPISAGGLDPIGRGPITDPMRMPSPGSGLLDRVRELTVRR